MKYLKVFTDFADAMEELGDAERGRLFTAMLKYAETGAAPDFRGNERFIWPGAKLQIDRMAAECEGRAKTSRENGSKGGRPKKTQGRVMCKWLQNIASGLWIVLGVYCFLGLRKWGKRFSELYEKMKEELE